MIYVNLNIKKNVYFAMFLIIYQKKKCILKLNTFNLFTLVLFIDYNLNFLVLFSSNNYDYDRIKTISYLEDTYKLVI